MTQYTAHGKAIIFVVAMHSSHKKNVTPSAN